MSSLENVHSLQHKLMLLDLLSSAKLSKGLQTFATQIEPKNVVHFFKCMESSCDFTTDDSDLFLIHLSAHWENSFVCIYCREAIGTDVQLVQHMITDHNDRIFQCAFCFYRSRAKPHLVVHSMCVHKNDTVCGYLCKKVVEMPLKDRPANTADKEYVCTLGSCELRCLSSDNFLKHLYEGHPNATCFVCHKCGCQCTNPEGLLSHYAKVHGFKAYQCLYCSAGSNDEWEVMEHISQAHADYPFKLLIRSSHPPVWFKQVNTMVKESKLVPFPEGSCAQRVQDQVCAKSEPFRDTPPESKPRIGSELNNPVVNMQGSLPFVPTCFVCSVENCAYSSSCPTTFLNHIKEDHTSVSEFSCPCCTVLRQTSLSEFYVHLIDNHTTLLRCLYKNCSFVGHSREAVDDHVISVHQQYDDVTEDPEEPKSESHNVPVEESSGMELPVLAEDCSIKCERLQGKEVEQTCEQQESESRDASPGPTVGPGTVPEKWLSDAELRAIAERESALQAAKEEVSVEPTVAATPAETVEPEDNVPEPLLPLPEESEEKYVCGFCCQSQMEALEYFRHMSHGHGVKYFCGHCDRCYKVHRQLITHHFRFHATEEMSFKTFQDNTLMSVPQKVISMWQQDISNQTKKNTNGIAQGEKVSKDVMKPAYEFPEKSCTSHNKKGENYVSKKQKSNTVPKLPAVDASLQCETAKGDGEESQRHIEEEAPSKRKAATNVHGVTMSKSAGNTPKGSKKRKDKLASPQGSKIKSKVPNENKSPRAPKNISPRLASQAKAPKKASPKDTEQNVPGDNLVPQRNESIGREQLVQRGSPAAHNSTNTLDVSPRSAFVHRCVYCSKSYKVLKWALRHQKAAHPDKPSMCKLIEPSKLESDSTEPRHAEKETSEQLMSRNVQSSMGPRSTKNGGGTLASEKEVVMISLVDDDDDYDDPPRHSEKKKTWRRICVISSDSEEEEESSEPEGFSYYGVKASPLPMDKVFVYVHNGGVKIAYSQLATVMKLQPIVLLKRLELHHHLPTY
ncbi:uncharacterized protein LOC135371216 isoform X2 [Ornithodoros turicata]